MLLVRRPNVWGRVAQRRHTDVCILLGPLNYGGSHLTLHFDVARRSTLYGENDQAAGIAH
jgi:hypothetical protein